MMQKSENIRHKAYTVAIAFLLSRCIVLLPSWLVACVLFGKIVKDFGMLV